LIEADDLEWLRLHYPGMYFVNSGRTLQGCLWFRMSYSSSSGKGVVNPDENTHLVDGFLIEDAYDLLIEFDDTHSRRKAKEMGGRILHTKNKWQLSWADVHMYEDASLCLCPEPEEKLKFIDGFSLKRYFYDILIPYFYYQSYLGRFGKEPWKGSGHGETGILESYGKQWFSSQPIHEVLSCYLEYLSPLLVKLITNNKRMNLDVLCTCGSSKKLKECHPLAFNGLIKFHTDYWFVEARKTKKRGKQQTA